jgi:hypothetical protein
LYAFRPEPPVSVDEFQRTSMLLQLAVLATSPLGTDGAVPSPPGIVVVGVVVVGVVVVTVDGAGQDVGAEHLFAMKMPGWSFRGAWHAQQ